MRITLFCCLLGLLARPAAFAQTTPHWEDFIIFTAGYMGPNALPVPFAQKGRIDNQNYLQAGAVGHFSDGDNTLNASLFANIALVEDLVSFDFFVVPFEYFRLSDSVKAARNVYSFFEDRQTAIGDVYVNSNVQIVNRARWQAALRAGFKIPSSNMVGAARFTDSPGYLLEGSAGWQAIPKTDSKRLELFAAVGFFVYQTQGGYAAYRQNDAVTFGTGMAWQREKWLLEQGVYGYFGYFDQRDKPVVYRGSLSRDAGKLRFRAAFQAGLHDFAYLSPELSVAYLFPALEVGKRTR